MKIAPYPAPINAIKSTSTANNVLLRVGQIAPNFTLSNEKGEPVELYKTLQKGTVVLFLFPKTGSPFCTKQIQTFRDAYPMFQKQGAEILGVSSDAVKNQQQFVLDQQLPFSLLSDPQGIVRSQYGATGFFLPQRATFVIDGKSARILAAYTSQTNISEHLRVALEGIQKAEN